MPHPQIKELADEVSSKLVCLVSDMINENRKRTLDLYQTIEVAKSDIPNGAKLIECYETDKEYIILGSPINEEHNCDEMGCSTVSHVRMRISKKFGEITNEIELKPCPFCGGKASIVPEDDGSGSYSCIDGWLQLGCTEDAECPSYRVFSFPKKDQDLYIKKWNTRK